MQDFMRYSRQRTLPEIGVQGQQRIEASHAFIAGCGALGSTVIDLLVRAGVGQLTICDRDVVDYSNLGRQILYTEDDARVGRSKAEAALRRIEQVNSAIRCHLHVADITATNVESLMFANGKPDVIVDGLDNLETREILNEVAVKHGIPMIYGGAVATQGAFATILPRTPSGQSSWELKGISSPCLACLFPHRPPADSSPTCDLAGVLGSIVLIVGAFQVAEVLKILVGDWEAIRSGVTVVDPWYQVFAVEPTPRTGSSNCPVCGGRHFSRLIDPSSPLQTKLCGRDAYQISGQNRDPLDLAALEPRLKIFGMTHVSRFALQVRLDDAGKAINCTLFSDGRLLVIGVNSEQRAIQIYRDFQRCLGDGS
ncbi:MAG: ThiF family adenylyltransferase [Rhodocyclaceae bacterium]|nr:ThiF family adenylyltransferase [Rhodocyclaceae bacterium]